MEDKLKEIRELCTDVSSALDDGLSEWMALCNKIDEIEYKNVKDLIESFHNIMDKIIEITYDD